MARDNRDVVELALLGGDPPFPRPKSIGSLAQPSFDRFMGYSRVFFDAHRYSNDGPSSRLLETRLAEFHHTTRCVTFSSAFWGLAVAMRCLALPGKTEAVMPSLTYRRLAEIAVLGGLIPRFCDVDRAALAQTAETVAPCVTEDTALIVGVHPTVNCCDAPGLERLSERTGIPLLLDSVESTYETCAGRKVGSFGRAEGFSLHASKLINGFEGGYITTNDDDLADRLRYMRGFGFAAEDSVIEFGINAKLNEVHAAMALASLDELEALVARNRARYETYRRGLATIPGVSVREFDLQERCSFKNILVDSSQSSLRGRPYSHGEDRWRSRSAAPPWRSGAVTRQLLLVRTVCSRSSASCARSSAAARAAWPALSSLPRVSCWRQSSSRLHTTAAYSLGSDGLTSANVSGVTWVPRRRITTRS